jgi:hypothetical protein
MHDSTLDRTTNGTGEVHKHTFDEIRALDAGAKFSPAFAGTKVPTLDEAFDLAHGKINVYVDTKCADPQQLVDTIVRHDMQDHVVIYGNPFFLYEVRKIRPTLKVMPEAISPDICKFMVRAMQPQVLAFDANDFKDGVIACAKDEIYVDRLGDADNPETWQKAIDLGCRHPNQPPRRTGRISARTQYGHPLKQQKKLRTDEQNSRPERAFIISVAAFDWNCPQHIMQRVTLEELQILKARGHLEDF